MKESWNGERYVRTDVVAIAADGEGRTDEEV